MAKADHRAVTPRTERFATIAADYYPPLGEPAYTHDRIVPGIKLRGLWLQQAGFQVNEKIRIRVMQGCLVITAE
ncbi:toxic protein SymE [Pseudomonas flavescens]|uniref:Type I toxin-antitoxin system SymE family toxin n=3 Tax=Pseudomonadaceae TaxID=135621 RepID=A0A4Q9R462_9GAMM|nr:MULTISPECIES: SymE family type I addiction module toxin [Pseudomonadaceae]TBU94774.1 type I toxin-antitoxin system SymE family toxin [Stutzerimonas kirkiae]TBU97994.1 type I toxin-antitoxin system SymE family toxin [Stutzerimonas kirkiae]SDJ06860.1 toxic protein SymE [Pseudomonas flavescens]